MGEEGVRAAPERDVAAGLPEYIVFRLRSPMKPEEFVGRCSTGGAQLLVVAGVPGRHRDKLSRCTIEAALAYTAEDRVAGSRVRNDSLLFLMNLLAKKQLRDVVEEVDSVELVVVAGDNPSSLRDKCGGAVEEIPECNELWLQEMAKARIRRYSG